MADLSQQIQILISGQDNISGTLTGIAGKMEAMGSAMARANTVSKTASDGINASATSAASALDALTAAALRTAAAVQQHGQASQAASQQVSALTGTVNQLGAAFGLHASAVGQFGGALTTMVGAISPAQAGLVGLGVAIAGVGAGMAKMAVDFEKSMATVTGQLKTAGASGGISEAVTGLDSLREKAKLAGAGINELANDFNRAFEHADNVPKAMEGVENALNISIATGQSLTQTMQRLDAAMEGNVRSLRLLGIHMDANEQKWFKSLDATEKYAIINDRIKEKFQENTDVLATHGAALAKLEVAWERFGTGVGQQIIAWGDQLALKLSNVVTVLGTVKDKIDQLGLSLPNLLQALPGAGIVGAELGAVGSALDGPPGAYVPGGAGRAGLGLRGIADTGVSESRTEDAKARLNQAAADSAINASAHIKQDQKLQDAQFRKDEQEVANQERDALRAADAATRSIEEGLRARETAGRTWYREERTREDERYRAQEQDIARRQTLEERALTVRKTAEEHEYTQYVKRIEDQRTLDERAADERERRDVAGITQRERAETNAYDTRKQALEGEVRARQQADADEKESIQRSTESFIQDREHRKQAVVDGLRGEIAALDDRYKHEQQASQDAVKAAESAHATRLREIEDENKAAVRAITDETTALVTNIQDRKRAEDDAAKLRQYGEHTADAAYATGQAEQHLTALQLKGATPQEIAAAQHAINQAKLKEADLYLAEQQRLIKEGLDAEERGLKSSETAQKQQLADKTTEAKRAADAELASVKATETEKQRLLTATHDQAKANLEARVTAEERAASRDVELARNGAKARIDAINDALTIFQNAKRDEIQQLENQHKDAMQKLTDEKTEITERHRLERQAAVDTATKLIAERKSSHDDAMAAFDTELNDPDTGIHARFKKERDEAITTHAAKGAELTAAEGEFTTSMNNQLQTARDNGINMRIEIQKTYGNEEGGLRRKIEDAKQAAHELAQETLTGISSTKGSEEERIARVAALEAAYNRAAGAARNLASAAAGHVMSSIDPRGNTLVGPNGEIGLGGATTAAPNFTAAQGQAAINAYNAGPARQGKISATGADIAKTYAVNQGPSVTREGTIAWAQAHGMTAEQGATLYDLGKKYNVDPAFAMGVIGSEGNGHPDNPFSMMTGNGQIGDYGSFENGAEAFYKLIGQNYYGRGQTDTYSIYWGVGGTPTAPGRAGTAYAGAGPDNHPAAEYNVRAQIDQARQYGPVPTASALATASASGGHGFTATGYYDQGAGIRAGQTIHGKSAQADAATICGPVAVQEFMGLYGRVPTIEEALDIAVQQRAFDPMAGQANGPESIYKAMLSQGLPVGYAAGNQWDVVNQQLEQGHPVSMSSIDHDHYYQATGFRDTPGGREYNLGASGGLAGPWANAARIGTLGGVIYGTQQPGGDLAGLPGATGTGDARLMRFDPNAAMPWGDDPVAGGGGSGPGPMGIPGIASAANYNGPMLSPGSGVVHVWVDNMGAGWGGGAGGNYSGSGGYPSGSGGPGYGPYARAGGRPLSPPTGANRDRYYEPGASGWANLSDTEDIYKLTGDARYVTRRPATIGDHGEQDLLGSGGGLAASSRDDWRMGGQKAVAASTAYRPRDAASFGFNPFQVSHLSADAQATIDAYNLNHKELLAAQERLNKETVESDRENTRKFIADSQARETANLAKLEQIRTSFGQGISALGAAFQASQSVFTNNESLLPGGGGGIAGSLAPPTPNPASYNAINQAAMGNQLIENMTNAQRWALAAQLGFYWLHTDDNQPMTTEQIAQLKQRYGAYQSGALTRQPLGENSPFPSGIDKNQPANIGGSVDPGNSNSTPSPINAGNSGEQGQIGNTGRLAPLRTVSIGGRGAATSAPTMAADAMVSGSNPTINVNGPLVTFAVHTTMDAAAMADQVSQLLGKQIKNLVISGGVRSTGGII